jgi:hypothetical protein
VPKPFIVVGVDDSGLDQGAVLRWTIRQAQLMVTELRMVMAWRAPPRVRTGSTQAKLTGDRTPGARRRKAAAKIEQSGQDLYSGAMTPSGGRQQGSRPAR